MFLWILVAFDCFKNFEQKHTETHRNSTQPMSRQTKIPSFLRDSAIFETTVQFPVNPYVTGSSPVARAKISADFCGFFYCLSEVLFLAKLDKNGSKLP